MDRKAAIRKYKETPATMGVFCVRNTATGKAFIGSSTNLPAMLNRQRFQLEHGAHPNRQLQCDWTDLGPSAFMIEALDTLKPSEDPGFDPAEDLKALEGMWREKLATAGPLY